MDCLGTNRAKELKMHEIKCGYLYIIRCCLSLKPQHGCPNKAIAIGVRKKIGISNVF